MSAAFRHAAALAIGLLAAFAPQRSRADEAVQRVAVLPVEVLATSPEQGTRVRQQLSEALAREFAVEVLDVAVVDAQVAARCGDALAWWDCLGDDRALLELGQSLDVQAVVAVKLASMGDTRVLNLRVADRATQTVAAEVVELSGADDAAILQKSLVLSERVFARAAPDPWYRSGWVWVAAGAGVVGLSAAVVASVLVGSALVGDPAASWDHQVELP